MKIAINDIQTFLKQIGQYDLLTEEKEKELFAKLKDGDENVKEMIINSNLRLVVAIAKKYRYCGLPLMDLTQEGTFGLMTAVDKFNPELGYRFSTYATYWIKQAITKAIINKGRAIRLPAHISDKYYKVRHMQKTLSNELGREPSLEEVAKEMHMEENEVKDLLDMGQFLVSLDVPVSDDQEDTLLDFVEDKHFEFVFYFTGINDNTTFSCSTEATQITQEGTPHVDVCTCETAEIRVTDSDQNIPYAGGQRRFCEFNASCVPDDGFDIKVVTKEGCTTDIVNTTNGIKYGKDPNTTNKYYLYGDINANRNADYRCEWLSICGTEFQIRQKGTGETPTKNCEVIFGATPAIIECEDGNQQLLTIYATRQDCANTQRNVKVKWSITKGDAPDPLVTGETAIYEDTTVYNEEIGTLFADTYTIKLEREQNRDYPKTASTTVTITEEDVCKSPTARVRILLQTVPDRNGSGQEFYIYNIDDLRVYFKSKNGDDIKNITLSSSWDAIDYAGVIAPGAVSSHPCQAGGDGKYFILQDTSERYPIVYQDVDIDFNGMVDPATDELTYTLYVREVCDSYDTEAGQCNCQHMSANAHNEIKTYNGSDPTPITNRGVNWGDCSALGTYLYFTSELGNIQGQMYCHKSDEGDASRRPDARYDNRINFVMDNLEMDNFYKADRDRDGYDVIMVIRMKPNEL